MKKNRLKTLKKCIYFYPSHKFNLKLQISWQVLRQSGFHELTELRTLLRSPRKTEGACEMDLNGLGQELHRPLSRCCLRSIFSLTIFRNRQIPVRVFLGSVRVEGSLINLLEHALVTFFILEKNSMHILKQGSNKGEITRFPLIFQVGWERDNPLTAEWALRALIDFTLSNARLVYSSIGNPLAVKGIKHVFQVGKDLGLDGSNLAVSVCEILRNNLYLQIIIMILIRIIDRACPLHFRIKSKKMRQEIVWYHDLH